MQSTDKTEYLIKRDFACEALEKRICATIAPLRFEPGKGWSEIPKRDITPEMQNRMETIKVVLQLNHEMLEAERLREQGIQIVHKTPPLDETYDTPLTAYIPPIATSSSPPEEPKTSHGKTGSDPNAIMGYAQGTLQNHEGSIVAHHRHFQIPVQPRINSIDGGQIKYGKAIEVSAANLSMLGLKSDLDVLSMGQGGAFSCHTGSDWNPTRMNKNQLGSGPGGNFSIQRVEINGSIIGYFISTNQREPGSGFYVGPVAIDIRKTDPNILNDLKKPEEKTQIVQSAPVAAAVAETDGFYWKNNTGAQF